MSDDEEWVEFVDDWVCGFVRVRQQGKNRPKKLMLPKRKSEDDDDRMNAVPGIPAGGRD